MIVIIFHIILAIVGFMLIAIGESPASDVGIVISMVGMLGSRIGVLTDRQDLMIEMLADLGERIDRMRADIMNLLQEIRDGISRLGRS